MRKQEREHPKLGRIILIVVLLGLVLAVAWCLSPVPALLAQQTAQQHVERFVAGEVSQAEIVSEQWQEVTPFFRYRTSFAVHCKTAGGGYHLKITGGYLPLKVEQAGQTQ